MTLDGDLIVGKFMEKRSLYIVVGDRRIPRKVLKSFKIVKGCTS